MRNLAGKRVVVVGLGTSGIAAVRLCLARGADVTATDAKSASAFDADVLLLTSENVDLVLGGHADAMLNEADLIVVSPGVPMFPELAEAEKKAVPVISEIELATSAMMHVSPVVAVGGTNGKSTVTSLIGELLTNGGKNVFVGGNLGEPLAAHADERFDAVVLEVSSFQLERLQTFRPRVSVLLNITADHLDRYPDMAAYANAKGNAFERQTEEDFAVVPYGDDACMAQARRGHGKIVTFGPGGDVDVQEIAIVDKRSGFSFPRSALKLEGGHNALNVAASLAAVASFDLDPSSVKATLRAFAGLPHRMAFVREISGVRYYDDSKGTNVGATVTAISGLIEPQCVLICGGKDKGGSYAPLAEALRGRGRAAVIIGEAADAIEDELAPILPVVRPATMVDAVRLAKNLAQPGDAVLLSPACSSFDMFRDYKHRGEVFVAAVLELAQEAESSRRSLAPSSRKSLSPQEKPKDKP